MKRPHAFHGALIVLFWAGLAQAAGPATTQAAAEDHLVTTEQQITLDGKPLAYQATAGTLLLRDDEGKPRANFFFVAYTRRAGENFDPATRPVTFVFNGGPGAAAVWLHLGAAGPRRVALDDNGDGPAPPYQLTDNPQTWLDVTDLVFIDPVGTGYSRPAEGVEAKEFYGAEKDISSVGQFLRLYCTRYGRWPSPKFLAGESYGTTRAAGLSQYLLDHVGMQVSGVILISPVLDFQTIPTGGENRTNDLPCALAVGSYAATAWYHKKMAPDLQADLTKTLAEVQKWTLEEYLPALGRGDDLPPAQRQQIARQLARYTAMSEDLIDRGNLRIDPTVFRKHLLADQKRIIGRFDTRLSGDDADPASDATEYDPSLPPFFPAYTALMSDYARRTLKYESDLAYETLSDHIGPWSLDHGGSGYLDVADSLRWAMLKSPHLKVMFASGYFDLATPFMSADYTISHMNLSPELRANITRRCYEAGHMIYHRKATLTALKVDVARFIESASH